MEFRAGNEAAYLIATRQLDDLRREAFEASLAHKYSKSRRRGQKPRRRAGRLPRTFGHMLILLGRMIAAEPMR